MKKTINVAIGGCSFTIDEDAYNSLYDYLERFKASLEENSGSSEIMDELEGRIADLLKAKLVGKDVVSLKMVQDVTGILGYPETSEGYDGQEAEKEQRPEFSDKPVRKLYRDTDSKKIAGVCSGLALFFGLDVVLIRIIFLITAICGMAGGLIYIIIWIVAPEARTAAEKCEMRGIPVTAENIKRFTGDNR